jgi:glutamate/tyrosine decarboxylase-like PLP-dependent enzyme
VSARDAHGLKAKDFHRVVIYLSRQAHHCIHKAIRISGMGEAVIRTLEIDEHYRIRPDDLAARVKADKAAGLLPFLVVATAGTTDTGAVDPIVEISSVARAEGLWLHVDAAYGGFFILCEEGRAAIRGLELSDSIVMDPHKTLFLPYGLGAVLVKDRRHMLASHFYLASYLQDAGSMTEEVSPADVSPELTKHFRGLRMWLPLMMHGVAPFRAALTEKILLCRHFYSEMSKLPGIEMGPYPDLSVTMFRYVPESGDVNALNKKWVEAIHRNGRVFLSSTNLKGQIWIRMAVVSFRTHLSTLDAAMQMLQETLEEVKGLS